MVEFAIEIPEMTTTEGAITSFILSWAAAANAVELISLPALRLK